MPPTDLMLTPDERTALERLARSRRDRMDHVTRAQGILMLADGATYAEVHQRLGWSSRTTAIWKTRFLEERLPGLRGRHRGSKPTTR
jgi:transposase